VVLEIRAFFSWTSTLAFLIVRVSGLIDCKIWEIVFGMGDWRVGDWR